MSSDYSGRDDYLKRLPDGYYQGRAYVHWSMAIQDRSTGWLCASFHLEFREILTHAMFRYGVCCPIYCCMPDHIHLLWIGILESADQRVAAKFFRKHLNRLLSKSKVKLQGQGYDHVLREEEREKDAFETVAEYIARNPERAGLVPADHYDEYEFTGCVVPGYPELHLWQEDFWTRFWRTYSYLCSNGLIRNA